jgi:hypothetical protein
MRLTRRSTTVIVAAALIAGGVAAPAVASGGEDDRGGGSRSSDRLDAVGLSNAGKTLVAFRTTDARDARKVGDVTLDVDTSLVGVDYRVQDGKLYGVGDEGGIYVLDAKNAAATRVGRLTVALEGTSFGVDFNPAVDRLRIVSDTGQNLRVVPDTGVATVDGTLNDGAATPATALGVTGAGYTNNDAAAGTATTLFDIDTTNDRVSIQAPPNAGTLNPTGTLGVDASAAVGFDVYSTVRDGTTVDVRALASLPVGDVVGLYRVDLLTGAATLQDTFVDRVIGLAIPLAQR